MLLFTHRNTVVFVLINICSTQLFMLKQITAACFASNPAIPIIYREKLHKLQLHASTDGQNRNLNSMSHMKRAICCYVFISIKMYFNNIQIMKIYQGSWKLKLK